MPVCGLILALPSIEILPSGFCQVFCIARTGYCHRRSDQRDLSVDAGGQYSVLRRSRSFVSVDPEPSLVADVPKHRRIPFSA